MTKRKAMLGGIHEDAVLRKKVRRKRQAVGVPKTAAVRAITKRNETESPLLRLPWEIRRLIWAFALGDKLLHIRNIWPRDPSDHDNNHAKHEPRWSTICCILPYTETELVKRSKRTVEELLDVDEAELGLFTDPSRTTRYENESIPEERREMRRYVLEINPHFYCMARYSEEELAASARLRERDRRFLPTQIVRVCRQIYIEANPIIWKTNAFSFAHAKDFKHFMRERTTAQKASISALRFDINWTDRARRLREWENHACQLGLIRSLRGLRSFSLHIEQDYAALAARVARDFPNSDYWESCFDTIARFRILPLQSVTVVLANARHAEEDDQLSLADRVEIAERVREKLLDPDGVKNFEVEQALRRGTWRR